MKEILSPVRALQKLLPPQKLKADACYKLSQYALELEVDGKHVLFNTLTQQAYEMDRFLPPYLPEGSVSEKADLAGLVRGYFYVPEEQDECAFYESLFCMMHTLLIGQEIKGYTILPTLACNARCVYCFEAGMPQTVMTMDTAEQTVRYMLETRSEERIDLNWFGGEPLLAVSVIDRICGELSRHDVLFTSYMVTNGSLITEEVADWMAGPWRIRNVQISMDGAEKDYIARKQYVRCGDQYHAVLQSVNLLNARGIRVSVRCNVDRENIDGVLPFLEDLKAAVKDKELTDLYFAPLNAVYAGKDSVEIQRKIENLRPWIRKAGFVGKHDVYPMGQFRARHCIADLGSVVIAPDGGLYACDECIPNSRFGNVWHGVTDPEARQAFCRVDRVRDSCRACPFLPRCTPFASCPIYVKECRKLFEQALKDRLKRVLQGENESADREHSLFENC